MRGTGRDPLGRYAAGGLYDLPEEDEATIREHVERGWGRPAEGLDHPGRDTVRIAHALIRGDALLDPAERAIADEIADRAHAIAHTSDPGAPREAAQPELLEEDDESHGRKRKRSRG